MGDRDNSRRTNVFLMNLKAVDRLRILLHDRSVASIYAHIPARTAGITDKFFT